MNSSKPPVEPDVITEKLRAHFDKFDIWLKIQAEVREHATTRSELVSATDDLRRWREGMQRKRT